MIADLTGRLMHKKKLILGVVAAFGALTAIAAGAYLFLPGALPASSRTRWLLGHRRRRPDGLTDKRRTNHRV